MKKQYSISIYLDTRREKTNKLYPVKLRVYANQLKKQKLYPTKYEMTEKEFQQTWLSQKPRSEFKEKRLEIQAVENKANKVAVQINPFSFSQFEKKLFLKSGDGENVFYQYQKIIEKNEKFGRLGNASNYGLSQASLKNFMKHKTGYEPIKLSFTEVDQNWLESYEYYMLNEIEPVRSRTTVSMYLRALRAVFNFAINENDIPVDIYPFGKNKYQIPSEKKVKKALSSDQLKTLFNAKPENEEQERSKDFWFFSFACNGMNMKDIALLKHEDIEDDKIVYYRAKTVNTAKADLSPIVIYLNDYSKSIISKYSVSHSSNKDFVFPIISKSMTESEKFNKIKNFTRSINQNIKKLALNVGLPSNISTYWARHSWASSAIRKGESIEFVSEALNHRDTKTTQKYIAGFEDEIKKEFSKNLMSF